MDPPHKGRTHACAQPRAHACDPPPTQLLACAGSTGPRVWKRRGAGGGLPSALAVCSSQRECFYLPNKEIFAFPLFLKVSDVPHTTGPQPVWPQGPGPLWASEARGPEAGPRRWCQRWGRLRTRRRRVPRQSAAAPCCAARRRAGPGHGPGPVHDRGPGPPPLAVASEPRLGGGLVILRLEKRVGNGFAQRPECQGPVSPKLSVLPRLRGTGAGSGVADGDRERWTHRRAMCPHGFWGPAPQP